MAYSESSRFPCSSPGEGREIQQRRRPLRIAILLNYHRSKYLPVYRASYERRLGAIAPDAELVFFTPAGHPEELIALTRQEEEGYDHEEGHEEEDDDDEGQGQAGVYRRRPGPSPFDLVVVGGANLDARRSDPWILALHGFLRARVRRRPDAKIVGICWGHQTIARVFGGEVVDMDTAEKGLTAVYLTHAGSKFFPPAGPGAAVRIQQNHRREVAVPGEGFVPLAHGNQILLNERNTILTFQGHPEKDAEMPRLRMADPMRWPEFDAQSEKASARLEAQAGPAHDGQMVWERILRWVDEPGAAASGLSMGRELKM